MPSEMMSPTQTKTALRVIDQLVRACCASVLPALAVVCVLAPLVFCAPDD